MPELGNARLGELGSMEASVVYAHWDNITHYWTCIVSVMEYHRTYLEKIDSYKLITEN